MTTWSIIGCGPSLDWASIDPPGTVICVNRALQGATRADYWCCIDVPNAEHKLCVEDARRVRPVVLTQPRKCKKWSAWKGLELRTQEINKIEGDWVHKAKNSGTRYSIIYAISWAARQGAEEIHFYGVDLAGSLYHTGPPAREKGSPDPSRWDDRWRKPGKELDQMRRVYQAATERGLRMCGLPESVTQGCPSAT